MPSFLVCPRLVAAIMCVSFLAAGTPAPASAAAGYTIRALVPAPAGQASYAIAINNHGAVVGQMGGVNTRPFLAVNGRTRWLDAPRNVTQALVVGIDDSGMIALNALDPSGNPAVYTVAAGSLHRWTRLTLGRLQGSNVEASAIGPRGDVAGSFFTARGRLRSLIWVRAKNGRYHAARMLSLGAGFDRSITGVVFRHRGRIDVAGAQGYGGGQVATIWSPSPQATLSAGQLPFISAYATRKGAGVAAGTTWGQGTSHAWYGGVTFGRNGSASLRAVNLLPLEPGYPQAVGTGVSVSANGSLTVVGDAANDGGGPFGSAQVQAVIWRNGAVEPLQDLLPPHSGWQLTEAAGINRQGLIAGQGVFHGRHEAFIMAPPSAP